MSKKLSESVVRRMIVIAVADLAVAGNRLTGDVVKELKAEAIKDCEEGGLPIYKDDGGIVEAEDGWFEYSPTQEDEE